MLTHYFIIINFFFFFFLHFLNHILIHKELLNLFHFWIVLNHFLMLLVLLWTAFSKNLHNIIMFKIIFNELFQILYFFILIIFNDPLFPYFIWNAFLLLIWNIQIGLFILNLVYLVLNIGNTLFHVLFINDFHFFILIINVFKKVVNQILINIYIDNSQNTYKSLIEILELVSLLTTTTLFLQIDNMWTNESIIIKILSIDILKLKYISIIHDLTNHMIML